MMREYLKKLKLTEKDLIVYKNVLAAFTIKGFALLLSLFMMPAYMRFFEDQRVLGVWYTILSVLSWILSFDLGIGNGLRNKLSATIAQNDAAATRDYVSSAYWMVGKIVVLAGVVGMILLPYFDWNALFNISSDLVGSGAMTYAVGCAFIGILLQFFLRLISSVIYAMQKSAINDLLALGTSVLQLLFLLIAPNGGVEQNLKMFSTAYIFFANFPLLVATFVIFSGTFRDSRPRYRYVDKEKSRSVLSLGGVFFLRQVLYMLIANTNEFFITQYTGPEMVVEYQIYNKLFTLGSMLFGLALTPIWSVVSKAIAENDMGWLKSLYRKLKLLSWAGIFCEFLIIAVLQFVINLWLGAEAIQVDYLYAVIFAVFGAAMIYQSMLSSIANGMGKIMTQVVCYGAGFALKFAVIHFGIALTGSWITVVLANAVIIVLYCIVQKIVLDKILK